MDDSPVLNVPRRARRRKQPRSFRRAVRGPVLAGTDWLLARAGLYRAEVNSPTGFFAQLAGVVGILRLCERRGLTPALALTSPLYADAEHGRDFLGYFFEGPRPTAFQRRLLAVLPTRRERDFTYLQGWSRDDYPPVDVAGSFFARYYRLRPDVADEVRAFAREHMPAGSTLGVHFRGTDKAATDSTPVGYDEVALRVRSCLRLYPRLTRVLVATDEPDFVHFLAHQFPKLRVITPPDRVRATGAGAVHLSAGGSAYAKGRDALVNALLLAECTVLLKTVSNLSGWSRVFRPSLPTFLLNRPAGAGLQTLGFPEKEMVERNWFADRLLAASDPATLRLR